MSTGDRGRRADAVRNRELALAAATALLGRPDTPLTVENIAKAAGLGTATVVRAFGGKEPLLDAAVSGLLRPVVRRAAELRGGTPPGRALRTFLGELIGFQAAHHELSGDLAGLDLPDTTRLRAELTDTARALIDAARRDGDVRTDLDPDVTATLLGETAYAIARTRPAPELVDAYLTVFLDGLRPR